MADIKRWVAYLFLYSNRVKKGAAGYARLETRDNTFKIAIYPEIQGKAGLQMKVFFACNQPGRVKGVYIGDIVFKDSKSEFIYTSSADDIGGIGLRAEDLEGLLLYNSSGLYLASEWNDTGIISNNLEEVIKEDQYETGSYESSESGPENESEPDNDSKPQPEPRNEIIFEKAYEVENKSEVFEAEYEDGNTTSVEEVAPKVGISGEETSSIEVTATMTATETIERIPDSEEVRARFVKLFTAYPKMFVFDDDEYEESIRIDLGVLTRLYEKEWFIKDRRREKLVKNSFILHGFYRYRHLLMVKRREDGKYLLLVPGVYNAKEKGLAEMFGFGEFKCIKRSEPCVGGFGYWSVVLTD